MDENQNVIVENNIPEEYKPLSVGKFIGFQLLFAIPCVGLILAIIFACGGIKNKNLINWARAQLIILGVVIAIYVILIMLGIGTAMFGTAMRSIY